VLFITTEKGLEMEGSARLSGSILECGSLGGIKGEFKEEIAKLRVWFSTGNVIYLRYWEYC